MSAYSYPSQHRDQLIARNREMMRHTCTVVAVPSQEDTREGEERKKGQGQGEGEGRGGEEGKGKEERREGGDGAGGHGRAKECRHDSLER